MKLFNKITLSLLIGLLLLYFPACSAEDSGNSSGSEADGQSEPLGVDSSRETLTDGGGSDEGEAGSEEQAPSTERRAFSKDGITVTLTDEFEENVLDNKISYVSPRYIVGAERVPFSVLGALGLDENSTALQFAEAVIEAQKSDVTPYMDGDIACFIYESQSGERLLQNYTCCYRTPDAFYTVQFIADRDDFEASLPLFREWSRSVEFYEYTVGEKTYILDGLVITLDGIFREYEVDGLAACLISDRYVISMLKEDISAIGEAGLDPAMTVTEYAAVIVKNNMLAANIHSDGDMAVFDYIKLINGTEYHCYACCYRGDGAYYMMQFESLNDEYGEAVELFRKWSRTVRFN